MSNVELRCDNRLAGILNEDGHLEISCRSSFCKGSDGAVAIHVFDVVTGDLIETKRYKEPIRKDRDDASGHLPAVRLA